LADRAAFELSLSVERRDGDAGRNKSYGHECSGTFRQNAPDISFSVQNSDNLKWYPVRPVDDGVAGVIHERPKTERPLREVLVDMAT